MMYVGMLLITPCDGAEFYGVNFDAFPVFVCGSLEKAELLKEDMQKDLVGIAKQQGLDLHDSAYLHSLSIEIYKVKEY